MNYEKCCGVVTFDDNKVLIIKHKYGHISFPKGHIENNETEQETAIREVKEETGIDAKIISNKRYCLSYNSNGNSIEEVTYFIGKKIGGELNPQVDEINSCYFVDKDKAIDLITFENDRNMYLEVLNDIKKGDL